MKFRKALHFAFMFSMALLLGNWMNAKAQWNVIKEKLYELYYTPTDKSYQSEYAQLLNKGLQSVTSFFHTACPKRFDTYVHPDRRSLDSTWQKDWKMPGFHSECWMVASGTGNRLDLIAPHLWDQESCEHHYEDQLKTQQLITHELVHVFHGQHNPSPDFSNVTDLDWLVEGLATYVSGQCDSSRMAEVKQLIREQKAPDRLSKFWTGKWKYGLSGSLVLYIDHRYGREQLFQLLALTNLNDVLAVLKISEAGLLKDWNSYIIHL